MPCVKDYGRKLGIDTLITARVFQKLRTKAIHLACEGHYFCFIINVVKSGEYRGKISSVFTGSGGSSSELGPVLRPLVGYIVTGSINSSSQDLSP
ncbi:hypothetical protein RRG08_013461 [Elysia crispata]|uniref:Uncharacterized protein n=1 Tax=Elysia crispata TaxID=231223 RepID=A0AAE1B7L1_9GAST|nr:hypothetical protein RRG08_013461 [Elysia crispata]